MAEGRVAPFNHETCSLQSSLARSMPSRASAAVSLLRGTGEPARAAIGGSCTRPRDKRTRVRPKTASQHRPRPVVSFAGRTMTIVPSTTVTAVHEEDVLDFLTALGL